MNFKTTIALVVTLAVLLGAFYLLKDRQPPVTTVNQADQPLVFQEDLSDDDITAIEITVAGRTYKLAKEGGAWIQTEPARWKLNEWRVETLAAELTQLAYAEKFEPGVGDNPTLGDVALDSPKATITFEFEGQEPGSYTVLLGRTSLGGKGYAAVGQASEVLVVPDRIHTLVLDEGPEDWRAKTVTFPAATQAQRVSFSHEGQTVAAEKEAGVWQFAGDLTGRVSADKVRDALQLIRNLRIDSFAADQPESDSLSRFGLANPAAEIEVTTAAPEGETTGQTTRLLLGGPVTVGENKRYAAVVEGDQPIHAVLVVTVADIVSFQPTVDDLRDPRVVTVSVDDVNRVAIERAELDDFVLENKAEGWAFVGDEAPPFEPTADAVDALIKAVTEARGVAFVASPEAGEAPLATITLGVLSASEPQVLRVLKRVEGQADAANANGEADERYVVVREGGAVGYEVPVADLAPVFEPTIAMRSNTLVELKASDLTALKVEPPNESAVSLIRKGGAWQTALGKPVEIEAVADLVKAVTPVQVKQWQPGLAERVRLAQPWVLEVRSGETSYTLNLWPDAKLGRLGDATTLFTISDDLAEAVKRELRQRTVLSLGAASIAGFEVLEADQVNVADWQQGDTPRPLVTPRGPAQPLVVRRDPAGVYTSPNDVTLDQGAVARLADTIGGLRAERFVTMKPAELGQVDRVFRIRAQGNDDKAMTLIVAHRTVSGDSQSVLAFVPAGPGEAVRWFSVPEADLTAFMARLVVSE